MAVGLHNHFFANFMPNFIKTILNSNIGLVCIVILLGFLAHSFMLTATFKTLDDNISIINNEDIKDFSNTGKIFKASFFGGKHYYRPMVSFSYMVEYHLIGLRSFYYNLTNLTFHLSIAITVFFLVFLICKDRNTAFFTSLLFAVHPIQWEAVSNISGRAVILSTFFTMNAFFFYCLSREKKRQALFFSLSLLFFTCGLLSKESAAMLPILLLSYIFLIEKDIKRIRFIVPYFLIIGVYFLFRRSLGIAETYPWPSAGEHVLGFLTFLRVCLTYLRLVVWPLDLHFDRAQAMFLSFGDPQLWATILIYTALAFILVRMKKRLSNTVIFFITWFCIELFPASQIITTIGVQPGVMSAAEHFLYMPVIGIFVLLVLSVRKLITFIQAKGLCSAGVCRLALTGLFLFLMLTTARQGFEARTALTMFHRSLDQNPNNARIQYSMGLEMAKRERFQEAEYHFRRALDGDPNHMMVRVALGRALHDQGKFVEGIAVYQTVHGVDGKLNELLKTNLRDAYQHLAEMYQQQGDAVRAQEYFKKALPGPR